MQLLTNDEIEQVHGSGALAGAVAKAAAISAVAGATSTIPSPATPALVFVALATGLLAIGLGWADSQFGGDGGAFSGGTSTQHYPIVMK